MAFNSFRVNGLPAGTYTVDNSFSLGWSDARIYRSATKTVTVDDGAGGAATLNVVGVASLSDGTASAPAAVFASEVGANSGWIYTAGGWQFSSDGTVGMQLTSDFRFRSAAEIHWTDGAITGSVDTRIARVAAGVIGLQSGANPQGLRPYGYVSGSRAAYGRVQTAKEAVTLTGATTATGNIIPAGAFVVGVATTTTTTITGASGYTVGDGADADRYGDITGTAVGTNSDNTDATADPTGYNAAASAITLTAKTSNFTGGVVQVVVFYLTTGAS